MSLNNFIPQLWADTLLAALRKNLVYGNLYNEDYQGTISRMGDTVKINAIGDITISNYTKDTDLAAPQALTDAQANLIISQAKYYNFEIDDVDQAQATPSVMGEAMAWAAYRLADTIDQYLAGFYTDAPAANILGTDGSTGVAIAAPTQANVGAGLTVYDQLVVVDQLLTQALAPRQGRWCVVPPWVKAYLMMDVRFTGFNTPQARSSITSGKTDASAGQAQDAYVGKIEAMDVYESVNAPHTSGTVGVANSIDVVMAGHNMTLTKATGLNKTEAYRPPLRFADAVKGLCLYGAKTVRPNTLVTAYFKHP
jgi:hypothetical protein